VRDGGVGSDGDNGFAGARSGSSRARCRMFYIVPLTAVLIFAVLMMFAWAHEEKCRRTQAVDTDRGDGALGPGGGAGSRSQR
jgi:hypothetical protein